MNIDAIRAAAKRIDGQARRTPLLSSPFLDEIAGRRVLIKAECLQHGHVSADLNGGVPAFDFGNCLPRCASALRDNLSGQFATQSRNANVFPKCREFLTRRSGHFDGNGHNDPSKRH